MCIRGESDEMVKKAFMIGVEVPYFVAGVDEHWLDEKVGWWVVFGVEKDIKSFWEDLFIVPFHVSFCMIDCGNIGVGTEKVEDNLAEGYDVYGEVGVFSTESADKGSE